MAGDKRILTDILLEAAAEPAPGDAEALSERIRAALLLNSSNSPESCTNVDGIAYAVERGWRGLVIRGTSMPLSALTESFARLDAVPPALVEEEADDLSIEDFRAAMLVITAVLRGFERPLADGDEHT